jgi:hypothetical protein
MSFQAFVSGYLMAQIISPLSSADPNLTHIKIMHLLPDIVSTSPIGLLLTSVSAVCDEFHDARILTLFSYP